MAPIWVTEVRPGIAKWIYFVGFAITAIASWLLRDYSEQALKRIPEVWPDIDSTAQCGVLPSQTEGSQAAACHCTVRYVHEPGRLRAAALPQDTAGADTTTLPAAEQVAGCVLPALQQIAKPHPRPAAGLGLRLDLLLGTYPDTACVPCSSRSATTLTVML